MAKNTVGGKGHKRAKNQYETTKNIPFKSDDTDYAMVANILGGGRLTVHCFADGKQRLGHIRGSMYKRVWIAMHDIVLISKRDFQDNKCDIIHKYSPDDVRYLVKRSALDPSAILRIKGNEEHKEDEVIFGEDSNDEIEGNNDDIDVDKI
jgi:translation initiation factor 1A